MPFRNIYNDDSNNIVSTLDFRQLNATQRIPDKNSNNLHVLAYNIKRARRSRQSLTEENMSTINHLS